MLNIAEGHLSARHRPGGAPMAIMVFTVMNGLGVAFLLYVLVQFWREEHRTMKPVGRDKVIGFPVKERPRVLVVTHPISISAHGGLCVVSRQAGRAGLHDATSHGASSNT